MKNLLFIMYERGFGWNLIRSLFSWLDSVAYTLFSWVLQLVFDIAEVSTSDAFNNFYGDIQSRIYALLAIFMLFKITISMLTYLVNPDSFSDKNSGIGKLSIRVVVSLVMLVAFPIAFDFLDNVQPHILTALPRVILGTNVGDTDLGSQMENAGKNIAFQTYNGVFFNTNCADLDSTGECFAYGNTVDDAVKFVNEPVLGDSDSYKYDYIPLVGFITAIVMTLILLGYCVDIAVRVFKLIILQLIAPIPIISYIDPKSSKDGAFSKWIKMVISVWADLFIKLAIVYFVMLVISELFTSGAVQNLTSELFGDNFVRGGLVTLALVIGLLFFAKDAPKFICDAMGIKMSENGKLFGGLGKIMAAGAIGAGSIGSAVAGARSSWMADEANGKKHHFGNVLKNAGAGLFGGVTGLGAGASAAVNAKDHYAKSAMDAMAKKNATALAAGAAGSTAFGRAKSTAIGLLAGETLAAGGERRIKSLEDFNKALGAVGSRAKDEMVKQNWTYGDLGEFTEITGYDSSGNAITATTSGISANYKSFMAAKNAAATEGKSSFKFLDNNGNSHEITMQSANMQEGWLLKNNEDNYIQQTTDESNVHYDSVTAALAADAESKAVHVSSGDAKLDAAVNSFYVDGKFKVSSRDSIKKTQDAISMDSAKTQRKNATNKANDRFSSSGK